MKFYQIRDPYYALIVAKSPEECRGVYEDVVADLDDEGLFFESVERISSVEALVILADACTEEGDTVGFYEAASQIMEASELTHGELLLVDGDLI